MCATFAARTPDTGNTTGRPLAAAVHWLRRSLTAYNSGSVTPSDAGGSWRIIMVFPAAILVCRTAHWGLRGKERTCYAGYSVVKVQDDDYLSSIRAKSRRIDRK